MKKLLDLRFVIGLFFTAIGFLLCLYYFVGRKEVVNYFTVNIWCGLFFVLFGVAMIVLSFVTKDPAD